MNDADAELLLASIDADRLVILFGAGLSMAAPSRTPSAAALASICSDRYRSSTNYEFPADIRSDLEQITDYFYESRRWCTNRS